MSTLKTAGELRSFLADVLVGIRDGSIDPNKANAIAKVTAQINHSLQVEVATRLQLREQGNEPAGGMLLGAPQVPDAAAPIPLPVPVPAASASNAKMWCEQCDRRVTAKEATSCTSAHCKAKPLAA